MSALFLGGVACAERRGMAVRLSGQAGIAAVLQTILTCRSQTRPPAR